MIQFKKEQWDKVKSDAAGWWNKELGRPLIQIRLTGAEPNRKNPVYPFNSFTAHYPEEATAEEIVDSWHYHLSSMRFLGDSFPHVWMNFGAGVVAEFLGSKAVNTPDSVWFHPMSNPQLDAISSKSFNSSSKMKHILEIASAADKQFNGSVIVGTTDLGGNLDILASLRETQTLLMDLYDNPEGVKKAMDEIYTVWHHAYEKINKALPANQGYSCWASLFSKDPYYMLQSDLSYMLSPDMFDKFTKPELGASCRKLSNPFYHLDGIGELAHLDSLLEIEELKGVQWIPGDGQPDYSNWKDVYRKIAAAGKLIQVFGFDCDKGVPLLEVLADQLGDDINKVALIAELPVEREDEAIRLLEKF